MIGSGPDEDLVYGSSLRFILIIHGEDFGWHIGGMGSCPTCGGPVDE